MMTYIFMGGPKVLSGQAEVKVDRRQQVWESISQLEASRQDMLIRANLRKGAILPPERNGRGGAWAAGYQEGFAQGYYVGGYLSASNRRNPFF